MRQFLDNNFLLHNQFGRRLYFDYAAKMPIIDYHNHLSPREIAEDKRYDNITEVWLKGDHYKWRAMRANGIDERYITGDASAKSKFLKWAETVPYTMRNPLYHWTHLELKRYFNIDMLLNKQTGEEIYETTLSQLRTEQYSCRSLLAKMKVEVVCTTDDPIDSLAYHKEHRDSDDKLRLLPGFRPDKFVSIQGNGFVEAIEQLGEVTKRSISSLSDLVYALQDRIDFFDSLGGRLSDHGLPHIYAADFTDEEVDKIFKKRLSGSSIFEGEAIIFQSGLLYYLARMYHAKGWVMQFHLGAIRDNNHRLMSRLGADVGCDSIGDFPQAEMLSKFLNRLDAEGKLTRTILYNNNPRDNEVFATMAGNYNDGSMPGKIQWGSAWWFLDQRDGMEDQLNVLSNMGLLSRFVGMLTDSRSFLSFPRHEYFRRILCDLIGRDVTNGELPEDIDWLGKMVEDICYNNIKQYIGHKKEAGK